MKFWFQPYIERPNLTSYVARASVLVKSGSGIRGGVEVELDMDSSLVWTSYLLLLDSLAFSKSLLVLSIVPNQ
jgi:hypothetical protein